MQLFHTKSLIKYSYDGACSMASAADLCTCGALSVSDKRWFYVCGITGAGLQTACQTLAPTRLGSGHGARRTRGCQPLQAEYPAVATTASPSVCTVNQSTQPACPHKVRVLTPVRMLNHRPTHVSLHKVKGPRCQVRERALPNPGLHHTRCSV